MSDEDKDASGIGTEVTTTAARVTLIRKRALCDLLGVSSTLRFLLLSMTTAAPAAPSKSSSSAALSTAAQFGQGNYQSLSLQCLSTRLSVVAALLESFEDDAAVVYADIIPSDDNKAGQGRKSKSTSSSSSSSRHGRVDSSVLLSRALALVQIDLLGCGTGQNCGEFPTLSLPSSLPGEGVVGYEEEALSPDEEREMTLFQRREEVVNTGKDPSYGESLIGALKLYTAVAVQLETLHSRPPLLSAPSSSSSAGNKRRSGSGDRKSSAVSGKKASLDEHSSPFKERLEEEYELTIAEEEERTNGGGHVASLEDRFPHHLADLMTYLLSIIRSHGRYLDKKRAFFQDNDDEHNEETAVLLRETAGKCLLQLLTLKRVNKSLLPLEWLSVSTLLLDPNPDCRHNILSRLCSLMQTHCLHPRFLALPCLAVLPVISAHPASGASASASQARMTTMIQNALLFALKRLRCTHESLCAQVSNHSLSTTSFNFSRWLCKLLLT